MRFCEFRSRLERSQEAVDLFRWPLYVAVSCSAQAGRLERLGLGGCGRVEVPRPVQLGSLKSENEGQDPGIRLVPAGGGGWGRPDQDVEEEKEESQQLKASLTSQPAQLRPTAWGRSSVSAQAGPRPAPWAQPPPGKVVPEPVPMERQERLGSVAWHGRRRSSHPWAPIPRVGRWPRPASRRRWGGEA